MSQQKRLLDYYLPPLEGFVLESLIATTYELDFAFLEEELLAEALGIRSPFSKQKAFRSELERALQRCEVTVLFDIAACKRMARTSPRIDPIPVSRRKLHSKITLQLWVRPVKEAKTPPERRIRLVIGSANLTRQGFRENYECVTALDFGGRTSPPRELLTSALGFIREISADVVNAPLLQQLLQFESEIAQLPAGGRESDEIPRRLVDAEQVLPALAAEWRALSEKPPEKLTVVSPFWPEGAKAADGLLAIVDQLLRPPYIELVCRGVALAEGKWLPEFDPVLAVSLRERLQGRLYLRPTISVADAEAPELDKGDETEDAELSVSKTPSDDLPSRALHAKVIALSGPAGIALYIGSSNCTRRGLAISSSSNFEAGCIYRLGPGKRNFLGQMLTFAGPSVEVLPGVTVGVPPDRAPEPTVPRFLLEVVCAKTIVTIRFCSGAALPSDLVITMDDPTGSEPRPSWLLFKMDPQQTPPDSVRVDLQSCRRFDPDGGELPGDSNRTVIPHVVVDVLWSEHRVRFPVRFEDKASLPVVLLARKPSEGELIDYYVLGRVPDDDGSGGTEPPDSEGIPVKADEAIDTRRILSYFMRRFVQAIPGIEAEMQRACYSRAALEATLRGPTSPLALAEHAAASLDRPPGHSEPRKTPTAVAFQLVEIAAALARARDVTGAELQVCYEPVVNRCRELIAQLVAVHPELQEGGFSKYHASLSEGVA